MSVNEEEDVEENGVLSNEEESVGEKLWALRWKERRVRYRGDKKQRKKGGRRMRRGS